MKDEVDSTLQSAWLEKTGLPALVRIPKLAIRLDNLGIGIAGILATAIWGTVLDGAGSLCGGVPENAISQFVMARQLDQPHQEPSGDFGIFHVWRGHQARCTVDLVASAVPFRSVLTGTLIGQYLETHARSGALTHLTDMGYGLLWLLRHHSVFFVFFFAGLLLIWSLAGGAICRISAVQFAREEMLTYRDGLRFAWRRMVRGFALAPCIPFGICLLIVFLMFLGGLFLWIPLLGDVLGGLLFVFSILGGTIIAALMLGTAAGGHLFFPAVATDGADGFDAFSRGFSYVFSKPWKAAWYAAFSAAYGAICWVVINVFAYISLAVTRAVVSFGTAPFGWGLRSVGSEKSSKLQLLWTMGGLDHVYSAPQWSNLGVFEYISAVLIGLWVLLIVAAVWSFLLSLYFSASTVCYFLLRRDVDGTDIAEVFNEEPMSLGSIGPVSSK
ncbi:MAG: hypothetical protein AABZ47_02370 [Planctomycetota bacterium]